MSFETKYLIRWGIPGWILIIFVGGLLLLENKVYFENITSSTSTSIGLLVTLGFFGVPIGYLMHQIYFSWHWVIKRKRIFDDSVKLVNDSSKIITPYWNKNDEEDYFQFEFIWHKELLKLERSKRDYISERYRHLLSTIHGLGALIVALGLSFTFGLVWGYFNKDLNSLLLFYLVITGFLTFACIKGFNYYSSNLNHFQGNFFNVFFDGELVDTTFSEKDPDVN